MKKVMFALFLVVVMSLALAIPVTADEGGQPNDDADFGQACADRAKDGSMGQPPDMTPLAWRKGGLPAFLHYSHGP